jgi:L-rhamnose-H+ transport protein
VTHSLIIGLAIVMLAGVFQGSFMLPSKWMRGWSWENYWLIFAFSAYLICPWLLALATIPRLADVYRGAPPATVAWVTAFGFGWGIGAVTFGLGVDAIGLALGFAVILGIAATSGTLIPLIVNPPAGFTREQGAVTALSLAVMLLGVALCSFAGKWKEREEGPSPERLPYRYGLLICVLSGLLSACGNLGFSFGGGIEQRAASLGASPTQAPNALWPLLTPPLLLCNAGYALYLLRRNRSASQYRAPGSLGNGMRAFAMGVIWMAGMSAYGIGASRMGALGKSLGWAILMSSMVLVANLLGILTGEWAGSPPQSRRRLALGIGVLLLAIAGLGYANSLEPDRPSGPISTPIPEAPRVSMRIDSPH